MKSPIPFLLVALAACVSSHAATLAIEGRLANATTGPTGFGDNKLLADDAAIPSVNATDGTATLTLSTTGSAALWSTSYSTNNGTYDNGEEWNVRNYNGDHTYMNSAINSGSTGFLAINVSSATAIDLTSIGISLWRNGDGAPKSYQLAYSSDGTWNDTKLLGTKITNENNGTGSAFTVAIASGLPTNVTNADFRLYYVDAKSGTYQPSANFHVYNVSTSYDLVPEPSAALLGALGALALLRRRR